MAVLASLVAVIGLALAHLFAGRLRFLEITPRSRWLSFAGGVSVAYVFVHLLPELSAGQRALEEASEGPDVPESGTYLVALVGLALFYGLERAAVSSRRGRQQASEEDATGPGLFRLHVASFALYNFLIGYLLLHRNERGLGNLALFTVAMALHFVVNDFGLREHHKAAYDRAGRWFLAATIVAGWVLGLATKIPEAAIALLIAFLAGGIVLNVLKEELPEERESRYWAFALGAGAYAALLLAL